MQEPLYNFVVQHGSIWPNVEIEFKKTLNQQYYYLLYLLLYLINRN